MHVTLRSRFVYKAYRFKVLRSFLSRRNGNSNWDWVGGRVGWGFPCLSFSLLLSPFNEKLFSACLVWLKRLFVILYTCVCVHVLETFTAHVLIKLLLKICFSFYSMKWSQLCIFSCTFWDKRKCCFCFFYKSSMCSFEN